MYNVHILSSGCMDESKFRARFKQKKRKKFFFLAKNGHSFIYSFIEWQDMARKKKKFLEWNESNELHIIIIIMEMMMIIIFIVSFLSNNPVIRAERNEIKSVLQWEKKTEQKEKIESSIIIMYKRPLKYKWNWNGEIMKKAGKHEISSEEQKIKKK